MAIVFIALKKEQLKVHAEKDQLHSYANKQLKTFRDQDELEEWFYKSEEVQKNTPLSFGILSKKVGFCQRQCKYLLNDSFFI